MKVAILGDTIEVAQLTAMLSGQNIEVVDMEKPEVIEIRIPRFYSDPDPVEEFDFIATENEIPSWRSNGKRRMGKKP